MRLHCTLLTLHAVLAGFVTVERHRMVHVRAFIKYFTCCGALSALPPLRDGPEAQSHGAFGLSVTLGCA
jgi:hypothetical protein